MVQAGGLGKEGIEHEDEGRVVMEWLDESLGATHPAYD